MILSNVQRFFFLFCFLLLFFFGKGGLSFSTKTENNVFKLYTIALLFESLLIATVLQIIDLQTASGFILQGFIKSLSWYFATWHCVLFVSILNFEWYDLSIQSTSNQALLMVPIYLHNNSFIILTIIICRHFIDIITPIYMICRLQWYFFTTISSSQSNI